MSDEATVAPMFSVRSFAGIQRADVPLTGINLIGGLNGAGKTSLLEAAACTFLRTPNGRGVKLLKNLPMLVKEGADGATTSLRWGDEKLVKVTWPGGEVETLGDIAAAPDPLAIGARTFSSLPTGDRLGKLLEIFGAAPTATDFAAYFAEHPDLVEFGKVVLKDNRTAIDAAAEQMAKRVAESGWDAVEAALKEGVTKRKGAWEQITKARWGTKVAETWRPPEIDAGEAPPDMQALEANIETARARLGELQRQVGASDEKRRAWQTTVDSEGVWQEEIALLAQGGVAIANDIADLVAKMSKTDPLAVEPELLMKCPHCSKPVRLSPAVGRDAAGGAQLYELLIPSKEEIDPAKLKAAREETERNRAEMGRLRALVDENESQQHAVRRKIQTLPEAKRQLSVTAGQEAASESDISAARAVEVKATAIKNAWERQAEAKRAASLTKRDTAFHQSVQASGVRGTLMRRSLDDVNAKIAAICTAGQTIKPVTIDADGDIYYDNRVYGLCSKSERWRADFVFALLIAKGMGSPCLLLDELDMIDPVGRAGPILALRAAGQTALIVMTARDESVLPKLRKSKVGATWWIDAGTLRPAKEIE